MVAHAVLLRCASADGVVAAPMILQRTEQEFVRAVLGDLRATDGLSNVAASAARTKNSDGVLQLFQPVHRTFHLVLLEVACDEFGTPRFDPERIVDAGLVLRRVATGGALEGWRESGGALRGWVTFAPGEDALDPDPAQRRPSVRAGHPAIDRR